jgi:hypothetical protein
MCKEERPKRLKQSQHFPHVFPAVLLKASFSRTEAIQTDVLEEAQTFGRDSSQSHLAFNHLDLVCHLDFDICHSKSAVRTSEDIIPLVRLAIDRCPRLESMACLIIFLEIYILITYEKGIFSKSPFSFGILYDHSLFLANIPMIRLL